MRMIMMIVWHIINNIIIDKYSPSMIWLHLLFHLQNRYHCLHPSHQCLYWKIARQKTCDTGIKVVKSKYQNSKIKIIRMIRNYINDITNDHSIAFDSNCYTYKMSTFAYIPITNVLIEWWCTAKHRALH